MLILAEGVGSPMEMAPLMEEVARETPAIGLIMAAETWYVKGDVDDPPDLGGLAVSEHPDRQEALMLLVFDSDGNREMWQQPFERDADDNPIIFDDYIITKNMQSKLDPWRDERDE